MKRLRIGFDVDGVLADFIKGYLKIANELTGKNISPLQQDSWDFTAFTKEEDDEVWKRIINTENFWYELDTQEEFLSLFKASMNHELFFITSRISVKGFSIERQTATWLARRLHVVYPTVLVVDPASQKIPLCKILRLDSFIEDKPSTLKQMKEAKINVYGFKQPYNQGIDIPYVTSVEDYLKDVEAKLG